MKTYISDGDTVSFVVTDTNGVASGDGVMVGANLFGVAAFDAGPGDSCEVQLVGVFTLPKDSSTISIGDVVYWDGTQVTTTQNSNALIGAAVEDAATDAATVRVRLNGISV